MISSAPKGSLLSWMVAIGSGVSNDDGHRAITEKANFDFSFFLLLAPLGLKSGVVHFTDLDLRLLSHLKLHSQSVSRHVVLTMYISSIRRVAKTMRPCAEVIS